jgi:hypothetical protein
MMYVHESRPRYALVPVKVQLLTMVWPSATDIDLFPVACAAIIKFNGMGR